MDPEPGDTVTIRLPARLWSCLDAEMDNVVSVEIIDGDDEAVEIGTSIRDAGAQQVPWVDGQWPRMDQEIDIELPRALRHFAVRRLERSDASDERIGDQESLDLGRRAKVMVVEQME